MKTYKVLSLIVLLMSVFAFLIVPMGDGAFPAWISTELVTFLLLMVMVACVISLIH